MKDVLGFDPDVLHRRYLEERDKRLRPNPSAGYIDLIDHRDDQSVLDPFSKTLVERQSVTREVDVLVVGGGLAGLTAAASLMTEGVANILIVEQGGDFGGAWYWNRYPGVRCDIESYIYMPLLEQTGTIPSEKYAPGAEILAHCRRIGEVFKLYERALFQTSMKSATWNDQARRWHVLTDRMDHIHAKHLLVSNGPFHRPKLPNIPGLADFEGKVFHSSRWDYDYTGGASSGGLSGLEGKRVAVVGTGATGIQLIPHVARSAEHLYVIQRTPAAISPRNNRKTDLPWYTSQKPGWQRRRMENFEIVMQGTPTSENLVNDCWTDLISILGGWLGGGSTELADIDPDLLRQFADYAKMEEIRNRIGAIVADPKTSERLKPWFNLFCKRPGFSDDYLETFNRENVTLVDTNGKGVDSLTAHEICAAGKCFDVDCVVFATGFEVAAYSYRTGGYRVTGKNGVSLEQKWRDGMRTMHGNKISGFPNFQIVGAIVQAALTWNYPYVMTRQAEHSARLIKWSLDHDRSIDIDETQESSWMRSLDESAVDRSQFYSECTPGYYNNEGDTSGRKPLFSTTYGGGAIEYVKLLEAWETEVTGQAQDTDAPLKSA